MVSKLSKNELRKMLMLVNDDIKVAEHNLISMRKLKSDLDKLIVEDYDNPNVINEYVTNSIKTKVDDYEGAKNNVESYLNDSISRLKLVLYLVKLSNKK